MFSFRNSRIVLTGILVLSIAVPVLAANRIEAVKGKRYSLAANNGPWLIMVAAIQDVPPARRTPDGLNAWEAADRLVYELRLKGIPAYTWLQSMEMGQIKEFSTDPAKGEEKQFISKHEAVAVLAGNFPDPDDNDAKVILSYIKKEFEPEFLKDTKNGGLFAVTPGRQGPLARAHLTVNPLLSASDVRRKTIDPLVRTLNADMEYSLLKNRGKYTLRVATFSGGSIVQLGNQVSEKARGFFDNSIGSSLDDSGRKAWELTEALRMAKKLGYDQNYDAWVYHDRYRSLVTIGSFESPNDPRLIELATTFGGKEREVDGNTIITAEVFSIPRKPAIGKQPDKLWMLDATPKLMEVPGSAARQ